MKGDFDRVCKLAAHFGVTVERPEGVAVPYHFTHPELGLVAGRMFFAIDYMIDSGKMPIDLLVNSIVDMIERGLGNPSEGPLFRYLVAHPEQEFKGWHQPENDNA